MEKIRFLKGFLIIYLTLSSVTQIFAQEKLTFQYAEKDTHKLYMDVYVPEVQNENKACVFFVFGGGFINGARDDNQVSAVKEHFTKKGYVVISIDYRLGLRGIKDFSVISGVKNYDRAITMSTEDLISALDYTIRNLARNDKFTINTDNIIVMGSSAGAITALQADYAICNGLYNSAILPDTFRIAGVVSYAGAVFSHKGTPKYQKHSPAPTLLCHGTKDELVAYKKIQVFNLGLFGSDALARQFSKKGYGYHIRRYTGLGHQVAMIYRDDMEFVENFINKIVFKNRKLQIDETYFDPTIEVIWLKFKVKDLKKLL